LIWQFYGTVGTVGTVVAVVVVMVVVGVEGEVVVWLAFKRLGTLFFF